MMGREMESGAIASITKQTRLFVFLRTRSRGASARTLVNSPRTTATGLQSATSPRSAHLHASKPPGRPEAASSPFCLSTAKHLTLRIRTAV